MEQRLTTYQQAIKNLEAKVDRLQVSLECADERTDDLKRHLNTIYKLASNKLPDSATAAIKSPWMTIVMMADYNNEL